MKPRNPPLHSFRLLDQAKEQISYFNLQIEKCVCFGYVFHSLARGHQCCAASAQDFESFINAFRSSFKHSEQPEWQNNTSLPRRCLIPRTQTP